MQFNAANLVEHPQLVGNYVLTADDRGVAQNAVGSVELHAQ